MKSVKIYSYDGSFQGFLGTIHEILQANPPSFRITRQDPSLQAGLFGPDSGISSSRHSEKLWETLRSKAVYLPRLIYFAFLSEESDCEMVLAQYIQSVFGLKDMGKEDRAALRRKVAKWARSVEAEKTDLENSLLFVSAGKRIPQCHIAPKYNVLPLLSRHFRMRFGGSDWMIVDRRRNYGLFGSRGKVEFIHKGWETLRSVPVNTKFAAPSTKQEVRQAI